MKRTLLLLCLLLLPVLVACNAADPLPTIAPTNPPIIITVLVSLTPAPTVAQPTVPPPGTTEIAAISPTPLPTGETAPATVPPTATLPPVPPTVGISPPACGVPAGWVPYVVQRGDTVGSLAACSGASVAQIAAANCLTSADVILAGQGLWLPRLCAPPTTAPRENPTNTPAIPTGAPSQPGDPGVVTIDKREVIPGTTIVFAFGNFHPGSTVTVTFHPRSDPNTVLDRKQAIMNSLGAGPMGYIVPSNFPFEMITVRATDNVLPTPQEGTTRFTVVPATPTPSVTPLPTATETPTATPTVPPTPVPPSETPTDVPVSSETPTVEPSPSSTNAPAPG
jgi:LysM repeat protein